MPAGKTENLRRNVMDLVKRIDPEVAAVLPGLPVLNLGRRT
jgi:hypothetical protein